ncbi:MAG: hypothetical protein A2469_00590 [Candidatus Magasanikbacteria bacterium RIFOXYC2_FULL_40_16]|uniref:SLC41A/MgtE integral membrane domain-containing protein n=1 Tax=Candidatus Magasanikbacteria bacterium RIFOXYC2_FULL_40_16 TaxID=1798703 RepID=A0A1F6P1I0_9BACT|nr:MAG: hypothetical protein A2469_00590 [Candidatus Magasanikbacteria bacterium RIFOXYC2_FULL_40_16]
MNNNNHIKKTLYADDDYEPVSLLFRLRAPSLLAGLFLGIGISFIVSGFEEVLSSNVQIAFFLPFIVYIANAVGEQTGAIYCRDLKTGKAKFSNYFFKELALGIIFGAVFGIFSGAISLLWLKNNLISLSVTLATFFAIMIAPIVALIISHFFQSIHEDPAADSGPIATVLQDMTSVLIYGVVATIIML